MCLFFAASVSGLSMKFDTTSKYFRFASNTNINKNAASENSRNVLSTSITLRENDELGINCSVSNSKPAADVSIWITQGVHDEDEMKKLDIIDFYSIRNKDYTMRSIATAKYKVSRTDHLKAFVCVAENVPLDEKWETKRFLNILCKFFKILSYNLKNF